MRAEKILSYVKGPVIEQIFDDPSGARAGYLLLFKKLGDGKPRFESFESFQQYRFSTEKILFRTKDDGYEALSVRTGHLVGNGVGEPCKVLELL